MFTVYFTIILPTQKDILIITPYMASHVVSRFFYVHHVSIATHVFFPFIHNQVNNAMHLSILSIKVLLRSKQLKMCAISLTHHDPVFERNAYIGKIPLYTTRTRFAINGTSNYRYMEGKIVKCHLVILDVDAHVHLIIHCARHNWNIFCGLQFLPSLV